MQSQVYFGKVEHARKYPKSHSFTYPIFTFSLCLDQLSTTKNSFLFAYNQPAVFSIYNKDYLTNEKNDLKTKLLNFLSANNFLHKNAEKIFLITMPRFFGYVFNPVSFYIGISENKAINFLIAEVNNTFGEKHLYWMQKEDSQNNLFESNFNKEFFVSPFMDVCGSYQVKLKKFGEELDLSINLYKNNEKVFTSSLFGTASPFNSKTLMKIMFVFPWTAIANITRIHIQGLILIFKKQAKIYFKPQPSSINTILARQNYLHRFRLFSLKMLRKTTKDET